MALSITKLRHNLYKIVGQIIETGIPIELERHGRKLKIIVVETNKKLENLKQHPGTIVGNPEDLVHIDWSKDWDEEKHL